LYESFAATLSNFLYLARIFFRRGGKAVGREEGEEGKMEGVKGSVSKNFDS